MSNTSGLSAGRPSRGKEAVTLADLTSTDEVVRINFELPKSKRAAFKAYAANHDTTVTELLVNYVDSVLSGQR